MAKHRYQDCNFWKLVGGAERGKYAQGRYLPTIKSLLDTGFTSYLTHFLHNSVGAQLNIGSAQALTKRYKVTPMIGIGITLGECHVPT